MKVYYCGHEDCEKGHSFGPAVRSHQLIHFVMRGKGIYKNDYGKYEIKKGEAFLIRPGEVTYYRADMKEPWSYAWIAFDGDEAEALLERYYPHIRFPVCAVGDTCAVSAWFDGLLGAFGSAEENRERVLGFFYLIIGELLRTGKGGEPVDEEGYFKRAAAFIRHNYSYPIRISEIADHVGIDRTYLYRIFIRQAELSPKQYLDRFRLNEAKDMLVQTEYRITEIAYSCGYHDSASFCRCFQRETGMTPAGYRNRCREGEL